MGMSEHNSTIKPRQIILKKERVCILFQKIHDLFQLKSPFICIVNYKNTHNYNVFKVCRNFKIAKIKANYTSILFNGFTNEAWQSIYV